MTRSKAASAHLAISALIAMTVLSLILFVWYPFPLFSAIGGQSLVTLIISIDVCIGPLLTFVVFNPGKSRRELILDLSFIALLQILALIYGLYATFEGRPVYLVFSQGHFIAVTANTIDEQMLRDAHDSRFQTLPLWGPRWVGAKLPTEPQELSDMNYNWAVTGMGVHYQPKYFVDLDTLHDEIISTARPLEMLRKLNSGTAPLLDQALIKINKKPDEIGFIPLRTKKYSLTVLVDKVSGTIIDVLNIAPPQEPRKE